MMKRSSFSYKMKQSLSDITNSQSQEELNIREIEHLNRLRKENVALVKLLQDRDKTIELSRYELRNLREGIHKLQVQNWSLAQSNSQFLAEINLARNKAKALQHEVTCTSALLKAKKCCEQEKGENTNPKKALTTENVLKIAAEESATHYVTNIRRFVRSKSLGASTTALKIEATKRRQLRRKSAAQEVTENLFEIEDLQLTMPSDMCQKDRSKLASDTPKKEEEKQDLHALTKHQDSKVHRPLHRAAERSHSYKEVSLNTQMRRS